MWQRMRWSRWHVPTAQTPRRPQLAAPPSESGSSGSTSSGESASIPSRSHRRNWRTSASPLPAASPRRSGCHCGKATALSRRHCASVPEPREWSPRLPLLAIWHSMRSGRAPVHVGLAPLPPLGAKQERALMHGGVAPLPRRGADQRMLMPAAAHRAGCPPSWMSATVLQTRPGPNTRDCVWSAWLPPGLLSSWWSLLRTTWW